MSDTIWKVKCFLGVLFATLAITIGYELKELEIVPKYLLIPLSFIISTYGSGVLVNAVISTSLGRKLILRSRWVEGYWLLCTYDYVEESEIADKKPSIRAKGIASCSYEFNNENSTLKMEVKRYADENKMIDYFSTSKLTCMKDLRYVNYFSIPTSDGKQEGFSEGKFMSEGGSAVPNKYQGNVIVFNEGVFRRQTGRRISIKDVKKAKKENPEFWESVLLKKY